MNNIKTALLLGLMTIIILALVSIWGERGITIALIFSVLVNFGSYFFSDRIALRMYGAKRLPMEASPE